MEMDIYSRFTERAQKALMLAREEAKVLGHNYVGTEHMLLGLIRENEGAAARILKERGITLENVRDLVLRMVGKGDFTFDEHFGFTPRSKKVMELSLFEARNLGHSYIGTEHLLLALVREKEGVAARILMDLHVNLKQVNDALTRLLREKPGTNPAATGNVKTENLDKYSRDLTQAARNNELDPVIGRQTEIERIVQILSRRTKNNPVLIGEPGVGKSAVVEGLAQRIVQGRVTDLLRNKRLVSLDMSRMLAGAKFRGEFEERLKNCIDEVVKAGNVVLFIDEIHTIVGAGAAEGSIDAANILKPMLARGELQTIGATTMDEYRKHMEKDAALARRFQTVVVGEPSQEEAKAILMGLRDRYEAHHKVTITEEAIRAAVELSHRYISDRFLPDKAIDLMDEAASRVRINSLTPPPDMKALEQRIETVRKEKEEAVNNQNFEQAAHMRDEEQRLRWEMAQASDTWKQQQDTAKLVVSEEEIAHIVSLWTSIPVSRITQSEGERLMHLEEELHKRVIGQEEAVTTIAKSIRRARAGVKDPNRPIGSFMFLGPTGVGKTELCRALAEVMFGDEDAMIRLDMSEYMEKHSVSRMVGSPPGYVGYEEGGQLTEKVRRKPYSVVLLDEIEKAHPDVFNMLLQILEDGRLTDSQGRTVDFRNTVCIMTSNAGASTIRRQMRVGFGEDKTDTLDYDSMKDNVMEELKKAFRPEFLNRLDEIIVFHALSKEDTRKIVSLMLKTLCKRMEERDIHLYVTTAALDKLAAEGFDPVYGARPLRRAIQREVEDQLSEEILSGRVRVGDRVRVGVREGKLAFTREDIEAPTT